jgi:NAD(P)H-flavin reductase
MPEYEMTLVDQQRIARDTMAFWFDANGASFAFRAGQHADLCSSTLAWKVKATIPGPYHSRALLMTKGQS